MIDENKILPKYIINYIFEEIKPDENGLWLEFGVFSGKSINIISKYTENIVYGFDSFEGLPEDWRPGYEKGKFNMNGNYPTVNKNVKLIKGLFQETLEKFITENNKKISFLHLDADLYSSTKYVLDTLKHNISKDCIILFDELINFPEYDGNNSELRALNEWSDENKVEYKFIGICPLHKERAAIKIKNIKYEI
jgi:hypothetical protein